MRRIARAIQRDWWQQRAQRIEAHRQRIQSHLQARRRVRAGMSNPVFCIGLSKQFVSMHEAARFTRRNTSNIRRAVVTGGLCAGYRWRSSRSPRRIRGRRVVRKRIQNTRGTRMRRR